MENNQPNKQNRELNELELIQQKTNGIQFIKSYPILKKILKENNQIEVLQLALSYHYNEQVLYLNHKTIAEIFNCKTQSIRNTVNDLVKKGFISTTIKSNYNGVNGGSSSTIIVNITAITNALEGITNNVETEKPIKTEKAAKAKIEHTVSTPTDEIELNITLVEDFDYTTLHTTPRKETKIEVATPVEAPVAEIAPVFDKIIVETRINKEELEKNYLSRVRTGSLSPADLGIIFGNDFFNLTNWKLKSYLSKNMNSSTFNDFWDKYNEITEIAELV